MRFLMINLACAAALLLALPVQGKCTKDLDCKGNKICVQGTCLRPAKKECTKDLDCKGKKVCVGQRCVRPLKKECTKDLDCKGKKVCVGQRCVRPLKKECTKDLDCKGKKICRAGQCKTPAPAPSPPVAPKPEPEPEPESEPEPKPEPAEPPVESATPVGYDFSAESEPNLGAEQQVVDQELPAAPVSPTPATEPPKQVEKFASAYFALGGLVGGNALANVRGFAGPTVAGRAAGYWVATSFFHLGAFSTYTYTPGGKSTFIRQVDSWYDFAGGLSLALGAQIKNWLWLGFGLDAGVSYYRRVTSTSSESETTIDPNLYLSPKLELLLPFYRGQAASVGIELSAATPLVIGHYHHEYYDSSPTSTESAVADSMGVWSGINGALSLIIGIK